MGAETTCGIVWIHRQIVSSDCLSSADSPLDRKCSVTLACLANVPFVMQRISVAVQIAAASEIRLAMGVGQATAVA